MGRELFETDADVDVDALMARIRETAKEHKPSTPARFAEPVLGRNLQPVEGEDILQYIHRGALLAEAINRIPLKQRGWKGKLELHTKQFIKWFVHWNTKGQADFNNSVMRSLELISRHLKRTQENFVIVNGGLKEESTRRAEMSLQASEQSRQAFVRFEELTHMVNGAISQMLALERKIDSQSEQLRQEINQQINEQVALLSAMLEEIGKKADAVGVHTSELEERVGRESEQLRQEMNQQINEQVTHLSATLDEIGGRADAVIASSSGIEQRVSHDFDEMRMRLLRLARAIRTTDKLARTPYSEKSTVDAILKSGSNGRIESKEPVLQVSSGLQHESFDYFLFEHKYRGPICEIKRRQSAYLELFLGRQNVVDLGCGRGEFVELISENGINVTGIDSNQDMVEFCQDRGLRVVLADMFDYLSSLPDASLDGIFTSQVVEHLSPERILMLINLCEEKLKSGGLIVAETVNTNCPIALSNFYLDPTHVRPVPPEMLRFMFEQGAFRIRTFRFSSPLPDSNANEVLNVASGFAPEGSIYQDYAVVAIRG